MCTFTLQSIVVKEIMEPFTLKGTLGLENKEIAECAFFGDYYILGWGEPMAKIFGLWVN